jgi:hypothetical protein
MAQHAKAPVALVFVAFLLSACSSGIPSVAMPQAANVAAIPNVKPVFHWVPARENLVFDAAPNKLQFEYDATLDAPQENDECTNYAPHEPRVTIKRKHTKEMDGDKDIEYDISAKFGAAGLRTYKCTILMTDKSDKSLKAALHVRVAYPGANTYLYLTDYTGSKILKYRLPVTANELPTSTIGISPPAGNPVAVSVASDGTVFYAANASSFLNASIGECTTAGKCSTILLVPGAGEYVVATGVAIDSTGTSGYLVYSSGSAMATAGFVQPFSLIGGKWKFSASPLASVSQSGTPIFEDFPIGSPYAGASLDGNGDLAVALPYGLTAPSEPTGVAVFPGGSSSPTYYKYGGDTLTLAPAWEYGSNNTFYGLYSSTMSFFTSTFWFTCTVGTATCGAPGAFPANVVNAYGIAADGGTVYESTLGTLGAYPHPFPPTYGTQIIYVQAPSGGTDEIIQNNASGKPFQTPWGLAIGP